MPPRMIIDSTMIEIEKSNWNGSMSCSMLATVQPGHGRSTDRVDAFGALGPLLQIEERARHDLAESQGHDGQVIAAQTQRRRAENDAEGGRDDKRQRHSDVKV